jgi:hypothetical protein
MKWNSFFIFFSVSLTVAFSQERDAVEPLSASATVLRNWDPVRGAWLHQSMLSLSSGDPIPDRTFPEDLTPYEMMRALPTEVLSAYRVSLNENTASQTDSERERAERIRTISDRTNCRPQSGRTYGDPHLNSFDGATFSFQTVGEFVLSKSSSGNFEVQTRQQPQRDDFSLNTAVAMNVAGDRVCIYANEKPDANSSSALRVNGQPVLIGNGAYFLAHGGTITYSNNTYRINWPTGEVVQAEMRRGGTMNFINLSVQIFPCSNGTLSGLLGNADGNSNDDFDGGASNRSMASFSTFGNSAAQQVSNELEKEFLAMMARDLARKYRISPQTSLFDYAIGMSTASYTDESFPRVHRTVGDLSPDRQQAARRTCEEQGVRGDDLKGCIYDQAYLEIPPSPRPVIKDQVEGIRLNKVDVARPNVNPDRPNYDPLGKKKETPRPEINPQTISKPSQIEQVNPDSKKENEHEKPVAKPSVTQPANPVKPSESTPSAPSKPALPSAPSKPSTPSTPTAPTKPSSPSKGGKVGKG